MTVNTLSLGGEPKQPTGVQFATPGTFVKGTIAEIEPNLQQTDFVTGDPEFWDPPTNSRPKLMHRLALATEHRNGELLVPAKWQEWQQSGGTDDGTRNVYLRGSIKSESKSIMAAVNDAVRAAGADSLEVGGILTIQYTGDGTDRSKGNPPKLFRAAYERPALNLAQADPFAAPAPAAPAAPAAAPVQNPFLASGQAPAAAAPPAAAPAPAGPDPQAVAAALAAMTPEQRAALGLG